MKSKKIKRKKLLKLINKNIVHYRKQRELFKDDELKNIYWFGKLMAMFELRDSLDNDCINIRI